MDYILYAAVYFIYINIFGATLLQLNYYSEIFSAAQCSLCSYAVFSCHNVLFI
jgi:hypothetical protein